MTSSTATSPGTAAAIAGSKLGVLPPTSLASLLDGARLVDVPAGSTVHREGETAPHLYVVVAGLLRVSIRGPDGRTLTIRYCRPGALIGVATLFVERLSFPASIQALSVARVLAARPEIATSLARRDVEVAAVFLAEASERVLTFIEEIEDGAFRSVGWRVGRHLLDLAVPAAEGGALVASVTQQGLADAVGSVREVVVRELRALREAGIVATDRGGIRLLQPDLLVDWNRGS